MPDKGCNGWTNYETWLYALWLDNDYGEYRACTGLAQELYDDCDQDKDATIGMMARQLQDNAEETIPDLGPSVWTDLINAALGMVDWHEVAEHYVEGLDAKNT
jgi:hypothetical protein